MSDHEMLELAAKAIGMLAVPDPVGMIHLCSPGQPDRNIYSFPYWNPLEHDADAFRLASLLKLDIYFHESGAMVNTEDGQVFDENTHRGDDPLRGARLAIVRAAAAIGGEHEMTNNKLPPLPESYRGKVYSWNPQYTADLMRAYGQQCRNEALEQAADMMDLEGWPHFATQIRALKEPNSLAEVVAALEERLK